MPVFVIVTPSSPSASTAVSEPVRVIEPLTVKLQIVSASAEAACMILRIDDVIATQKSGGGPPGGGEGGMPPGMGGMPPGMGGMGGMPPGMDGMM